MSEPSPTVVLRVPPLGAELHDAVGERYEAVDAAREDVEAIVCTNSGRVDDALVAALPRLRVICNHGVGYDNIDLEACRDRGIAVSNTPEVLDAAVAETALGLLLATVRRLPQADRFVREERWAEGAFPLTAQVSGSRVGIVGLGRIGTALAELLTAMGCTVGYHNRREVAGSPYTYHPRLTDLASAVDALVLVVPGGPSTAGLVGAEVLDALGPDGVLVNVARGSVVDEEALVAALEQGRLGAAGLDVYAAEPQVPAALRAMDQVVLLPHVGSATRPTRAAMRELTLRNLDTFLRTGSLVTPVPELASH